MATWKHLVIFWVFLLIASSLAETGETEGINEDLPPPVQEELEKEAKKKEEEEAKAETEDEDEDPKKLDEYGVPIGDKYLRPEDLIFEGEDVKLEKGVLILNEANFDEIALNREIILVEFYAPWCGHCKKLAPEYEAAAQQLLPHKIPLAKVDATVEKGLAERFDIHGYPMLKFFKNGNAYDYEGGRESSDIFHYMLERASPDWTPPPEAVLTLTEGNFSHIVNREDLMLVEFYAPWCGHCKKMAPDYEKAAQRLRETTPRIRLGKVDATAETALASKFDVSGYPTLKVFRKGRPSEYRGERDATGIVTYMEKQRGDGSKEQATLKDLQAYMREDDVTVVGFFKNDREEPYLLFKDVSNELRDDYALAHTFNAEIMDHYKINPGTVVVFNSERFYTKYEPKWHTFEVQEGIDPTEIQEFITDHHVPLVGHMNRTQKEKRYNKVRPLVVFFYMVDWSFDYRKTTQMYRHKIADIAKDYEDMTFVVANEDDPGLKDLFAQFGFEDSSEEVNVGIMAEKDRKFPMPEFESFDSDEIRAFLDDYREGNIKPFTRSQPIPKKQKGPVKVVVGKNFEEIVFDKTKDVLIEFYAPWCGHCKKLEPTYKELAKKYKKDKNLVIAKMDATANDAPLGYEHSGFPTIYFAPSDQKDRPIKFEGGSRELEDLEDFMLENAVASLQKQRKDEL